MNKTATEAKEETKEEGGKEKEDKGYEKKGMPPTG